MDFVDINCGYPLDLVFKKVVTLHPPDTTQFCTNLAYLLSMLADTKACLYKFIEFQGKHQTNFLLFYTRSDKEPAKMAKVVWLYTL